MMKHPKISSPPVARRAWRTACLPLCFLCLAGVAAADTAPFIFPPNIPNGWEVYVEGTSYINANQAVSQSFAEGDSQSSSATLAVLGTGPSPTPIASPTGSYGGFADLTHGLVGIYTNAAGGEGPRDAESVDAAIYADLTFKGSGIATFTIHLNATTNGGSDDGQVAGQFFAGTQYCTDPAIVGSCQPFSNLPVDLVDRFVINSATGFNRQFVFLIGAHSNGFNSINAAETASISMDLSPGLTLDQSQGFLTQTGEPDFFATTAAPEPGMRGMLLAGLALVLISAHYSRWKRTAAPR
jgi:hypothetical protein